MGALMSSFEPNGRTRRSRRRFTGLHGRDDVLTRDIFRAQDAPIDFLRHGL
jgi:hypothetical protein